MENEILTKSRGTFAAKGIMEIVYFDYNSQQKTNIPDSLKSEFRKFSPNLKIVRDNQIKLSERIKEA